MAHRRSSADEEDAKFLATYDASRYPHPSVAVDVALVAVEGGAIRTLLLQRPDPPQRGRWGLPGTFVEMDEPVEDAAARALASKAGIEGVYLEQLYTFGAPKRDPRTRVISVAHYALLDHARLVAKEPRCVIASINVPWEGEEGGSKDGCMGQTGLSEYHNSLAAGKLVEASLFGDGFSVVNRGSESTGAGHSGTQNVFWNVRGKGMIRSLQFGWGYVIGTTSVSVVTETVLPMGVGTEPFDMVEVQDRGADLVPPSLYDDQRERRRARGE